MATQQDVIKAFMKSLDISTTSGVTALNNAVKACSSFKSLQSVIDKLISDCKNANSVENFLEEKCSIILDNTDTGAITGSDAGNSKIKTAESIIPESGTASYPSGTSFTKRGLTVVIPSKSTLTKDQQTVVQGLYSWWIEEALKLIEESYGYNFTDDDTTVKKITLKFLDSSSEPAAYVTNNSTSTNGSVFKTTELTLNVNMKYFKNLSASNINGQSSETSSYLDRVLAHELTHAIMAAKIDNAQELPNFIMEGMAELTHGADERTIDIKQLVANPTQLKARLNVNNVDSPADLDYSAGYIFLRYLAKQGAGDFSGGTDKTTNYVISGDNDIITTGGTYTIDKNFTGTITINTTEAVSLDGTNSGNLEKVKIITQSTTANLTIKNLNITNETGGAITFGNATGNKLTLAGKNVLKTSDTWAAVVNIGGGLTIDGTGSLDVTAGTQGSGIGFRSYDNSTANLIINGGNITVTAHKGASIGSGCNGSIGNITINGGTVTAASEDGASIGAGFYGSVGNIIITGGTVTATADDGAGIGAGCNGFAENITIKGGEVITTSECGAGIGAGRAYSDEKSLVGAITIKGSSKVTATSEYALGIGKSITDRITDIDSGSVKIGEVTVGKITVSGKSSVLITRMDNVTGVSGRPDPDIVINGKTYNDEQMLFKNGIKKNLTERIIIKEIAENGTAKSDYIGMVNSSWYNAFTINAGAGDDTIEWSGANILLYAGKGNDSVHIVGVGWSDPVAGYLTVDGGAGNDSLSIGTNLGGISDYYSSIHGGTGNDLIRIYGNYVTILGGAGNDSISNIGDTVTINAGAGNDYIDNDGNEVIIDAGKENDIVSLSSYSYYSKNTLIQYTSGDGNDTIFNFNSDDTLKIGGGTGSYFSKTSGNDVIVTVGEGKITLVGAASLSKVNIDGVWKDPAFLTVTNSTKSPVTVDSVVKTVDASKRTSAIKITGNKLANSISGGTKNDSIFGGADNDSILGNAGNDKLFGEVGNDSLNGGNGADTLSGDDGNDILLGGAGKDSLNGGNGADTLSGGNDNDILVGRDGNDSLNGDKGNDTINGGNDNDKIFGGVGNDSLNGGNGADTLSGDDGNDILLGGAGNDSLWGGAGNDTLIGNDGNDIFIYEAGNDFISDYTAGQDKIQIASGKISKTSLSGSDVLFTIGKGSLTVKNAKGKTISLIDSAGKASSTVVGAQALTNSNKASVTIAADMGAVDASARTKAIKITGNALANTISGGTKNDSIFGAAGNDSIIGNAGNDKLYGDAGNDVLLGGKGNDSLWGGADNDSLWGNAGKDVFIYETGKDVIADFTAGQDKIQIASGKISKTSLKGSDVLFTIGKGSLTVKNAKGKTISLLDSAGKASSTVVGAQALTNSNKANVTIGADMGFVDSSKRTKAISITGNSLANTISGGIKNDSIYGADGNDSILGNAGNDKLYGDAGNDILLGGKGNDSLWGGAGNDSLWGDAGKDTFFYTANEGTDRIFDYEAGDMLKILNADGNDGSFKSSKFSGGDLTLTINGGGKIIFDDVAFTTKFNINGSSYNISGSKLVKK